MHASALTPGCRCLWTLTLNVGLEIHTVHISWWSRAECVSTRDEALFYCTKPSGVPRGTSQFQGKTLGAAANKLQMLLGRGGNAPESVCVSLRAER